MSAATGYLFDTGTDLGYEQVHGLRALLDQPTVEVLDVGHSVVGAGAGQSLQWARDVDGHMHAAGLEDVRGREVSFTMAGGDVACRYLHSLVAQIARPLLGAGLTEAELTRFVGLMADPRFRGWFYQFVCTSGRKPA